MAIASQKRSLEWNYFSEKGQDKEIILNARKLVSCVFLYRTKNYQLQLVFVEYFVRIYSRIESFPILAFI